MTTVKIMSKENVQYPIEIKMDNNIKSNEAVLFNLRDYSLRYFIHNLK